MHPTIYESFRQIVSALKPRGRILEVGALPSAQSLLAMEELHGLERVGVNMDRHPDFGGISMVAANANDMSIFPDGYFDCVLSNATIEHDPFFWKSCAEMRRVLRVGGAAIIGAPAFTVESGLSELGLPSPWTGDDARGWSESALTFRYHGAPKDYYRFSPAAFREVIFEGYRDVALKSVMMPPRIIGYGFKT